MKPGDLLDEIKADAASPYGDQVRALSSIELLEDPFFLFPLIYKAVQ